MVTSGKRVEERDHGKRVSGRLEQAEVKDELVLRPQLQVIARLGLPVVHGVLLHAHERGVMVGFRIGVAAVKDAQLFIIFIKLAGVFLELPYLLLFFFPMPLLLFRHGLRRFLQRPVELIGHGHKVCRREILHVVTLGVFLRYGFVYLFKEGFNLGRQLGTVLPFSASMITNCVNTWLISSFTRLRKRLIVLKSGCS